MMLQKMIEKIPWSSKRSGDISCCSTTSFPSPDHIRISSHSLRRSLACHSSLGPCHTSRYYLVLKLICCGCDWCLQRGSRCSGVWIASGGKSHLLQHPNGHGFDTLQSCWNENSTRLMRPTRTTCRTNMLLLNSPTKLIQAITNSELEIHDEHILNTSVD